MALKRMAENSSNEKEVKVEIIFIEMKKQSNEIAA